MSSSPKVLVAGSAGFIGSNFVRKLLLLGIEVVGVDNFSPYYSPSMKNLRQSQFSLDDYTQQIDINNKGQLREIFEKFHPNTVVNLAAQGGVRASRSNPLPYLQTNQLGFLNLLELSKEFDIKNFIFASSSSVYGESNQTPFSESHDMPSPKSLYALSKLSNELVAKYYSTGNMKITGLRFFTVYGPWSRPDMAVFRLIASAILKETFHLSGSPEIVRDFTFVDDISKVIEHLIVNELPSYKFEIFNVAGGNPYSLSELFEILYENKVDLEISPKPSDPLDVKLTHGSIDKLEQFGLPVPSTSLSVGIIKTLEWFQSLNLKDIREWFEYSKNV